MIPHELEVYFTEKLFVRIFFENFAANRLLTLPSLSQSLPAPVKRRLKALKKLQLESTKVEAKFYQEIHELECRYHEMYAPIYQKRAEISKGEGKLFRKEQKTNGICDECLSRLQSDTSYEGQSHDSYTFLRPFLPISFCPFRWADL